MKIDHFSELKKDIFDIENKYPQLSIDSAFIVWFLRAFITDNEREAVEAIKGKAGDKSTDAVYLDHKMRSVFILQGKYHQNKEYSEKRADIIEHADLGRGILSDNKNYFQTILNKANEPVKQSLIEARNFIQSRDYSLIMQYISTGKISDTSIIEAEIRLENWRQARFETFSRKDLMKLMQDYIEGVAPPTPILYLPISGNNFLKRYDKDTRITTWIFSVNGKDIANIYNKVGIRLFARNIRGFLGYSTKVNKGMSRTIQKEPDHFWYYNNGITIVCDEAEQKGKGMGDKLKVTNAQIINGQQTTRSLAQFKNNMAEVLVKLIEIPRDSHDGHSKYSHLVSEIVSATNFQNAISQSDLKSNDTEQVRIEREFKKYNYFYLRKRMNKSEARKLGSDKYFRIIKRDVLARYLTASNLDPYEVRLGQDRFFDDEIYKKIFNYRHPAEYLLIYWLGKNVDYFSKTNPQYRYAKWPVLNFLWSELGDSLNKISVRDKFRFIMERERFYFYELKPLYTLTKFVFRRMINFYSINKDVYGSVQEPIDYFKHAGINIEFEKYFKRLSRNNKKRYYNEKDKFINNMQSIELQN